MSESLTLLGKLQFHMGVNSVVLLSDISHTLLSNKTIAHHSLRLSSASRGEHLAFSDSLWRPIRCAIRIAAPNIEFTERGSVSALTEIYLRISKSFARAKRGTCQVEEERCQGVSIA